MPNNTPSEKLTMQDVEALSEDLLDEFNAHYGENAFERIYYALGADDLESALSQHPDLKRTFAIRAHIPLNIHFLARALNKPEALSHAAWDLFKQEAVKPNDGSNEGFKPDFDKIQIAVSTRLTQERRNEFGLLPDAKVGKNNVQKVFHINPSRNSPQSPDSETHILCR